MARGNFPSAKQDQFMLRFPDGLRDHIKAGADRNGRSMNAEIVARLEQADAADAKAAEFDKKIEVSRLIMRRLMRIIEKHIYDTESADRDITDTMMGAVLYLSNIPVLEIESTSDFLKDLDIISHEYLDKYEFTSMISLELEGKISDSINPIVGYLRDKGWTVTEPGPEPLAPPPPPPEDD